MLKYFPLLVSYILSKSTSPKIPPKRGGIKSKVELNSPTEVFEYISLTMSEVDIWDGSYDSAKNHLTSPHLAGLLPWFPA